MIGSPIMRWGLVSVLTCLVGSTALAQESGYGWADPRLISPAGLGPSYSGLLGSGTGLVSPKPKFGFEAGEFIIQPRFFLEGEYRSNFFRIDPRNQDPEGAFALHIRPGFALFNSNYQTVALSVGVDLDALLPFGDEAVSDRKNVGGTARVALAFFPRSAFTISLYDTFERSLWMRPQVTVNANRNHNLAGVDLSFHPGGRALDFTLGYAYDLVRYDDIRRIDTDAHRIRFLGTWRFYPQTYAFLESTFSPSSYTAATANDTSATGNLVNAMPLRVYAGLSGALTERLSLILRAGFGDSFTERGSNFASFVGMLQASWRFGPRSVMHLGVARDFDLAPLGGYVSYLRAYSAFTQRLGENIELNIDLAYDIRSFGAWSPSTVVVNGDEITPVASSSAREEQLLRGGVLLDFNISRLFGATIGYRYESTFTDFSITAQGVKTYTGYDDHRLFATLNLRY